MRLRLGLALVALLAGLLVGCGGEPSRNAVPAPSTNAGPGEPAPTPTQRSTQAPTGQSDPDPAPTRRCGGVSYGDVLGPKPKLGHAKLRKTRVMPAVCAAYWAPHLDDYFTPQALEIQGDLAYVGGYKWNRSVSRRPCQIAVIDTRTGRTLAFVKKFQAPVYGPTPTYCRHGGGMDMDSHGLWVAELERLWLLDPAKLGKGDPVLRVWRLDKRVRGATVLIDGNRIGFGSYRPASTGKLRWFSVADVLRPGRTLISGPASVERVPVRLQGISSTDKGLWFSSSDAHCASLKAPGHKPVTFVHGAEDVEIRGPDLWTVSEAGVKAYLHGRDPIVPSLLRLDKRAVLAGGAPTCRWL
ncbi:hypothetical protein ABIE44_003190 [Marmoricola sp. OAE513]|uniref:hypothetical protein n=1 Tax=Marmoricola sp. OAE513 TaxID=2817894 RepID=UPI001AE5E797